MKRIQRFALLALALIVCLGSQAIADTAQPLQIQSAFSGEAGSLNTTVFTSVEGNLQPSNFAMSLDGADVQITSVSSYNRSELGTTYLFLLDTPRAMKSASFSLLKDTVTLLINQLGDADNAAILLTGGDTANLALTGGKDLLKQALNGVEKSTATDTLNVSIANALTYLQTAVDVKPRACLVVLSTGETRDETGMTQQELQQLVAKQPFTLYTYAFVTDETDNRRVTQANQFGSLARASVGGADTLVTGKTTAETLAAVVTDNEKRFLLLQADVTSAITQTAAGTLYLSLTDAKRVLKDEATLTPAVIADIAAKVAALATATPEPTEPTSPETTGGGGQPTDKPSDILVFPDDYILYILIGLGVVLLALVVALIVVSRRRKRGAVMDDGPSSELNETVPEAAQGGHKTQISEDDLHTEPVMERNALSARLRVTLTQVGTNQDQAFSADMMESLVVGRSSREARLVITSDPTISATHAKLTYDGSALRIEDLKSSNGTKINGVKIMMPTVLHAGDVLTLGRTSLRVSWQKI
ncbi:MAG TPA: FHA domain-containing protein [Candidatus Limiplasma sp.]|nr:FHA domain-containing protein [Candidatus Limiplasma sp.]HPS82570.1 FHA domain-containing protein [Candidatus Limiplasma sp.]